MRILLIGSMVAALSGCTMTESTPPAKPAATAPQGECDAERAKAFIGRDGAAVAEEARIAAGAKAVRVIGPNQPVTMDFRVDRLNLGTDAAGKVL
ncbi:MAG: hypothetical protein EOP61_16740, partial [Sphingomonadales bacterium]